VAQMSKKQTSIISELTEEECMALIEHIRDDEIETLKDGTEIELYTDKDILNKVNYIMDKNGVGIQDALEYVVISSIPLWAKVYLGWNARNYQKDILTSIKKGNKVILRFGRRLGKTDSMCIVILYYAYTQLNKGPNDQYDILIFGPMEKQVDLIFDRLKQLIKESDVLKSVLKRDVQHRLEWKNGTKIIGITAGASTGNGKGSTSSRGQRGDLIVLDEMDYIGSKNLTNIINIRNEAPERIKIISASTPSGSREEFYKWCNEASVKYEASQSDIDNMTFTKYDVKENKSGNGWIQLYAPSFVNKELQKINKDTGRTYLQDIRYELTENDWSHEVLAQFGEAEAGVYKNKYIDIALEEGRRIGHKYYSEMNQNEYKYRTSIPKINIRILGADWDKGAAATNFVIVELDKFYIDEYGRNIPTFKVIERVEIPQGDFTYTNGVDKIIELNKTFDLDWICIDKGYGETQLELLHKYGMEHPETGLHLKTEAFQFSESVKVIDPYNLKRSKSPMKNFMVKNSVQIFERCRIVLNPNDGLMKRQLEGYKVVGRSSRGQETYSDKDEHSLDAMNLALFMFERKYGELIRHMITTDIKAATQIDTREFVDSRDFVEEKIARPMLFNKRHNAYLGVIQSNKKKNSPFKRSTF
jgi:hypothetical protein